MTVSIANLTSQWTNSGIAFTGMGLNVNATAYAAGSYIINYKLNGTIRYTLDPMGNVYVDGTQTVNSSARVNGSLVVANTITANSISTSFMNVTNVNVSSIIVETLSSNTVVRDSKGDVRDLPLNIRTTPYALTIGDTGEVISTNTTIFVPNNVFFSGNAVSIVNNSASSITVTQNSSVTMHLSGTATTGNRTLAQRGIATILCIAANTFIISGSGLT